MSSQTTHWGNLNREFFLNPEVEYSLICIFPDGGSCTWTKDNDQWILTHSRDKQDISMRCTHKFNTHLEETYISLITNKELLEGKCGH
jgi:hypothetical protein